MNLGVSHNPEFKLRFVDHRLNLEESDCVPDAKNALKGIFRDAFDSRNRMRHVKPNDRLPIVRRSKGKIDLGPVCTTDHLTSFFYCSSRSQHRFNLPPVNPTYRNT